MSRRRGFIVTHATAATAVRWATSGKARLRKKYRHAVTACRILNRRECPLVQEDVEGRFGWSHHVKFSWGAGHIKRIRGARWPRGRGGWPVGWYGDWHTPHVGRPLTCVADLRRWVRTLRCPLEVREPSGSTESSKVLRRRTTPDLPILGACPAS